MVDKTAVHRSVFFVSDGIYDGEDAIRYVFACISLAHNAYLFPQQGSSHLRRKSQVKASDYPSF